MNDSVVFVVGGLVAVLIAFICHFVANIIGVFMVVLLGLVWVMYITFCIDNP